MNNELWLPEWQATSQMPTDRQTKPVSVLVTNPWQPIDILCFFNNNRNMKNMKWFMFNSRAVLLAGYLLYAHGKAARVIKVHSNNKTVINNISKKTVQKLIKKKWKNEMINNGEVCWVWYAFRILRKWLNDGGFSFQFRLTPIQRTRPKIRWINRWVSYFLWSST